MFPFAITKNMYNRTFRPHLFWPEYPQWTFRTRSTAVQNVLFCSRVCFLKRWTLMTISAAILNVLFWRRKRLLQKQTFRTRSAVVLIVPFCSKRKLCRRGHLGPAYFDLNIPNRHLGPDQLRSQMPSFAVEFIFCKSGHLGPNQLWS